MWFEHLTQESIMSSKRRTFMMGTIVVVAMALVAPAAQAFNPQPDPPARVKKSADKTWKYNHNVQPGNSGLLNNGSGFSTQTPSSVGTPIGAARGGGAGSR
jgi:hypothetical protein